jgi:hypothetical protein
VPDIPAFYLEKICVTFLYEINKEIHILTFTNTHNGTNMEIVAVFYVEHLHAGRIYESFH